MLKLSRSLRSEVSIILGITNRDLSNFVDASHGMPVELCLKIQPLQSESSALPLKPIQLREAPVMKFRPSFERLEQRENPSGTDDGVSLPPVDPVSPPAP